MSLDGPPPAPSLLQRIRATGSDVGVEAQRILADVDMALTVAEATRKGLEATIQECIKQGLSEVQRANEAEATRLRVEQELEQTTRVLNQNVAAFNAVMTERDARIAQLAALRDKFKLWGSNETNTNVGLRQAWSFCASELTEVLAEARAVVGAPVSEEK